MKYLLLYIFLIVNINYIIGCAEKIKYTGKINNFKNEYSNLQNKEEVLNELGFPNHIDPINKNYIYFSEKEIVKNFYEVELVNRDTIVFIFNKDDEVVEINLYNKNEFKNFKNKKDKIENNLIKRGLIEKIFGGIGKQTLPNTSN